MSAPATPTTQTFGSRARGLLAVRWNPSRDLAAVLASWGLVVGAIYAANVLVGPEAAGGMAYFALYAILGALVFGVGLPLYWTVRVRRRPVADLGITAQRLGISLALQLLFAALQFSGAFRGLSVPSRDVLIPLLGLSLAIGFFEAVFWRGWVLLRLEEAFGVIPAILVGSALYAAYHVGYAMPLSEITFLFFIGILYAVAFRLTGSVFILWPLFQPMGQLVTLIRDGLTLPLLAAVGFLEVLIAMGVLIWLAARYYRKAVQKAPAA